MAEHEFSYLGGHPAVDLTNTVANRGDAATRRELLGDPSDVARWIEGAGLAADIEAHRVDALRADAKCVARFRAAREALHDVLAAAAAGEPVPESALSGVDRELRRCAAERRLTVRDGEVAWGWSDAASACDVALYEVLTAAVELLTSGALAGVRACDGPGCGWLFLDRSRARRRRWCSMKDCGNRAKARRYYYRA